MAKRWKAGEPLVLRETFRGRTFGVIPATVVVDEPDDRRLLVWPWVSWLAAHGPDGSLLRTPTEDPWTLVPRPRVGRFVLSFSRPRFPHAVLAFYREADGALEGWYVNLETALRPIAEGFEYEDLVLDARIAADRSSWSWKDEDDFAEAVRAGRFTPGEADLIREQGMAEVRRVLHGEAPFDRDWTSWRPDPSWGPPSPPDPGAYGQ